jgi:predicted MFS family arabinose efflux permease
MPTRSSSNSLAVYLGVVQFFFATTWTVYVIYLPQLAQQAGIARTWVPWILVADQVIFAIMDVVTGFWVDRVRTRLARFGGWILGFTALSCAAFVVLPFFAASQAILLVAILVWSITSSALRSPPWALLARHAAAPSVPWLSALVLTGSALAAAAAPYLGMALRGVDPRVPFVLSTLTLLAAVGGLVYAERQVAADDAAPAAPAPESSPRRTALFFAGLLVMAIGFQVHFALNSAPQYLRFAGQGELAYLMPVFWIGFNLAMFPASRGVKRWGALPLMALAAAAGAIATLACVIAPGLNALMAAQFIAGGCWGAASVAAYSGAIGFGRTGREGRFLGTLFAALAIATLTRIAVSASGLTAAPDFKTLLPWLPEIAWLLAALVLLTSARARSPTRP